MANWKKVLVSGSQIHVAGITASGIPSSGSTDDRVVVFNPLDGAFKSVAQSTIQGVTEANFGITGSDGTIDLFNATADNLLFGGDITSSISAAVGAADTVITLNLPAGTVSSSAQIASDISGAFDSASNALVSQSNSTNILATANLSSSESNILNIVTLLSQSNAVENFAITIESSSDANTSNITTVFSSSTANTTNITTALSASSANTTNITQNMGDITDILAVTGSYVNNIAGTANEITVTSASANTNAQVVVSLPDDVTIGNDLTVSNNLTVLGIEIVEGQSSVVSGSFFAGSGSTVSAINALGGHQFTGSLSITGAFNVEGTATIGTLTDNDNVGVTNLVVHDSNGILYSAGADVASDISGAFDSASNALVSQSNSTTLLATANLSSSESNILNIVALLSQSNAVENFAITIESSSDANTSNITTALSASDANASNIGLGIHFDTATDGGFSRPLTTTASFVATNNATAGGFTVASTGTAITYTLADTFFSASGIISSSEQVDIGSTSGSSTDFAFKTIKVEVGPNAGGAFNVQGVVEGSPVVADQVADTLTLSAGAHIHLSGAVDSDAITISSSDENVSVANLTARLPQITENVSIGDANDVTVTIPGNLNVNESVTITKDLIVKGTTTNINVTNVQIEDQFILLNSGSEGSGNSNDKDGGFIVNTSTTAGEGTAFFYDFNSKVWALKGADGNSTVAHDFTSDGDSALGKDIIVATVSQSNVNPFGASSASLVPKYGIATDGATAGTNLGSMHVNSTSGEVWIYS